MPLFSGTRLGPYAITAQIGAGGMGEVYRATDTKLKREVAIKVLPETLSADAERLARFQREAEVLASLNHPHIAAIYGIEQADGHQALVMEFVEGDDLSRVIAHGPMPLDEALPIAKQIADALEAAHERGVVHRDLKPANIKVRPDGTVKVLDFGLAKAMEPAGGPSPGSSMLPTITTPAAMTAAGMILGTAAYMSPEQAKGRPADRRSDVWAFGCVLFEMLAGARAFGGEVVSETLADVLRGEPAWDRLPDGLPPVLVTFLKRCLVKDPKQRLGDIHDMRLALDGAFDVAASPAAGPAAAPRRRILLGAGAGVLAGALVAAAAVLLVWAPWRTPPPGSRPALRFTVSLGPDVALGNVAFALSPDGTQMAFPARGSDQRGQLILRPLAGGAPRELAQLTNGPDPFFSPDGQWVGFTSAAKLWKAPVQGGAPVPLCDVMNTRGASWGDDGFIVVAADRIGGLSRCPVDGGALTPLTRVESGEVSHRWPQYLPAAGVVLFTAAPTGSTPDANSIVAQVVKTGERKVLWKGGTFGRYLPSGHLVFVSRNTLFAVPLDLKRLEIAGTPRPIVDGVATQAGSDSALFDVSPAGTLVFATDIPRNEAAVFLLDRSGGKRMLATGDGAVSWFGFSPDGRHAAFAVAVDRALWIADLDRETRSPLPHPALAGSNGLTWTRDGRFVVYATRGARRDGIAVTRADGAADPAVLLDERGPISGVSVSPGGAELAFSESGTGAQPDVWTFPIDLSGATPRRTGEPTMFLRAAARPRFSPDGRWLAYASNASGRQEIYVRPFPGPGGQVQVSTDGAQGGRYAWSPAGKEIVYLNAGGRLTAVGYTASGSTFTAGTPRPVSPETVPQGTFMDVAPDGKSFAVIAPKEASAKAQEVTFVVNVFDEIRRKLAAGQ